MKKLFSSALLLLALICQCPTANAAPPRFSAIGVADRDYFNVGWAKDNGEMDWGLMNVKGNLIMAPKHQEPLNFDNSIYTVALREGKYGVMNHAGHNVIPYEYDHIDVNGDYAIRTKGKTHEIEYMRKFKVLGKVNEEKTGIRPIRFSEDLVLAIDTKTGKYGYLGDNGKTVIPFQYDKANPFSEGLAGVAVGDRVFYINTKGERAFEADFPLPHYEGESASPEIRDFTTGLVTVTNDANMAGLIDVSGNQVVPFIYDNIIVYPNGSAIALRENENGSFSWDILNHDGNKRATINHNDYYIEYDYETGIYLDEETDAAGNKSFYFANADGRLFNGQKFDDAYNFKKGNAFVCFPGEEAWSVINTNGEVIFREISATVK